MKLNGKQSNNIFIGTPEFGAFILEKLIKKGYKPVLTVTETDKPAGRKKTLKSPPVKKISEKNGIPVLQSKKIINLKSEILKLKPDLILVAAYGQILPKEILKIPKFGCLNVHPSLLPKWRGPSPIQYSILKGDKETGVSIMLMDEKMDHGPILSSQKLKLSNSNFQFPELQEKLAKKGAELLIETIPKWMKGKIKPKPQNESKAIYTKILNREDGKINWKKPAEEIERQVRAFNPWPGSFTFWEKIKEKSFRIKILKAKIFKSPISETFPIGKVLVVPPNNAGIQCGKDFLLIEKLQLEGQKPMKSEDFLRGHWDFAGTILK